VFGDPQINFYVQDVEASTRFYRESFGFTETFRTLQSGRPIHVELRLGQLLSEGSAPGRALLLLSGLGVASAGGYQAAFVGDDHELGAVPRVQLRHDAADVGL
jgi:catechol 2,3-dioxygenase-like lactoylglutathione lyase family enzyme